MRVILFIVIIFFEGSAFGQDAVENKVAKDICACLAKTKKNIKDYPKDFLPNCFQSGIVANANLFKIKKQGATKESAYETGRKYGEKLAKDLAVKMIYTCDSYFHFMDSSRYLVFTSFDKDSIMEGIQSLNRTDSVNWNADFYTKRGIMYFQIRNIENALKDFNTAIKLDSSSFQSMYFKAWSLEEKKEYEEAFKLYSALALLTNKSEINVLAAIAKRKKNGL